MSEILVTGGTGYIGSHTVVELIEAGNEIVIIDNLSNSDDEVIKRLQKITGKTIPFYDIDLRDEKKLEQVFEDHEIDSVIHFAGLKAVGESVSQPLEYYSNNVVSTLSLLKIMKSRDIKKMVFSSSATVYGKPDEVPINEDAPANRATNPYGWSKVMIEQVLQDLYISDDDWQISILRYFNPIGAHNSGLIGEDPKDTPNNLLPYIAQVAVGKLDEVSIFGDDYDTDDGTGVRDYIHVVDLAKGHLAALNKLGQGVSIYNLGTGNGTSVLELIDAFSKASDKDIAYKVSERRQGDIGVCYADCSRAKKELGWEAELSVAEGCEDSWRWQKNNPNGFSTS